VYQVESNSPQDRLQHLALISTSGSVQEAWTNPLRYTSMAPFASQAKESGRVWCLLKIIRIKSGWRAQQTNQYARMLSVVPIAAWKARLIDPKRCKDVRLRTICGVDDSLDSEPQTGLPQIYIRAFETLDHVGVLLPLQASNEFLMKPLRDASRAPEPPFLHVGPCIWIEHAASPSV
jgi:hypothetical protein